MMLKLKIKIIALLTCASFGLQAQTNQYRYKRDLKVLTVHWHSIQIPNEVFKKVQRELTDLRIYGYRGKDTVEVPYLLEQSSDVVSEKESSFTIINQSSRGSDFFYTFQPASVTAINQIKLSFKQENFDWRVKLEGSNDNIQWFTLLEGYRILSIKNKDTNYQFTDLNFTSASYSYFRMAVNAKQQPELTAAKILRTDTLKGVSRDVRYKSYKLLNDGKAKQSILNIELASPSLISQLKINVQRNFDFYRNIKIEFATDSFKTEKGIQYNFEQAYHGTISSLEDPTFNFKGILVSRLKITINNDDNPPLRISSVSLSGPVYEMVGRFDDPTLTYALYYGKKDANLPKYELNNFENKIPVQITSLLIGNEQINPAYNEQKVKAPLFENKLWLWLIMGLIIALLGFFAFKMLRN